MASITFQGGNPVHVHDMIHVNGLMPRRCPDPRAFSSPRALLAGQGGSPSVVRRRAPPSPS
eukprot:3636234-Pyramimonas_sp.AAC.1